MKSIGQLTSPKKLQFALLMGLVGVVDLAAILMFAGGGKPWSVEAIPIYICAFLGATLGGAICAKGFGHFRWTGYLLAMLTGIVATVIGAFTAGVIVFGVVELSAIAETFELASLAVVFVLQMNAASAAGLIWITAMTGIHIVSLGFRRKSVSARS